MIINIISSCMWVPDRVHAYYLEAFPYILCCANVNSCSIIEPPFPVLWVPDIVHIIDVSMQYFRTNHLHMSNCSWYTVC